jgi:ATP synthase subunit C
MRIERVIWSAMIISTLIYGFIVWMFSSLHTHESFEAAIRTPRTVVLYGLAGVEFLFGTIYATLARNRPLRQRMIVCLALYEGCAIFGLIAAFLAYDFRLYLAPWALAIIGFLRVYPTSEPG